MLTERRNLQLVLIATVQVFALSVWFSASAVIPTLRIEWGITLGHAVWLTASVQLGFVIGALLLVLLNLADRVKPHILLATCTTAAAVCTAALALFVNNFQTALPLRMLTGVFLAGVYPIGMKLVASWFSKPHRGTSMGLLLAALTLGSALPHLISGLGSPEWKFVLGTSAIVAGVGGVIAIFWIRPGPYQGVNSSKLSTRYVLGIFRDRSPRMINLGYFGHMWELYALWTWLPSFMIASELARGEAYRQEINIAAFIAIGIAGAVGSQLGGWLADRIGRPRAAAGALIISGGCCLTSPLIYGQSWILLVLFSMVWGASVIADSAVLSAGLSETVAREHIGTALTVQTAIGYLLTVVTIQLVLILANLIGWRFAFLILAFGPLIGAISLLRLRDQKLNVNG